MRVKMILATHGLFRGEGFQLADFSMKWHRESLRPDKKSQPHGEAECE
jgi:hypothetical protein